MINTNKLLPRRGQGNVVTTETVENLGIVRKKLVSTSELLKENLVLSKIKDDIERRKKERETREDRETKIESVKAGKFKQFLLPETNFLQKAFNFMVAIIIAPVFANLVKFLPEIVKFTTGTIFKSITFLVKGLFFIASKIIGGANLLYNGLRNNVARLFGEKGVKAFDDIQNIVIKYINMGLIAGMLALKIYEFQRLTTKNFLRNLASRQTVRQFAIENGKDAAIRKFGRQAVKELGGRFSRSAPVNLGRRVLMSTLGRKGVRPLLQLKNAALPLLKTIRNIPFIGSIIEFLLRVFLFKEPLGMAAFLTTTSGIGAALGALVGSLLPGPGTIIGGILGGMAGDAIGRRMFKFFFPKNIPTVPDVDGFNVVDEFSPENQAAYDDAVRNQRNFAEETGSVMADIEQKQFIRKDRVINKRQVNLNKPKIEFGTTVYKAGKKIVTKKQFGGSILSGNIDSDKFDALMESMYYEGQQTDVIIQPIIKDNTKFVTVGSDSQNTFIGSKTISGFNISDYFYERGAA